MARILIVEDNPANMKLTTLLLRNAGHDVLSRRRRRDRAHDGARGAPGSDPDGRSAAGHGWAGRHGVAETGPR